MPQDSILVFVCEHGAAKSIVAVAHFNKLAGERNLGIRAISRGTTPEEQLSPKAVEGLASDGLIPFENVPQKLSSSDVEAAARIISFCELPAEIQSKTIIDHWEGIPAVSEDYEKARDAIVEKINELIEN